MLMMLCINLNLLAIFLPHNTGSDWFYNIVWYKRVFTGFKRSQILGPILLCTVLTLILPCCLRRVWVCVLKR